MDKQIDVFIFPSFIFAEEVEQIKKTTEAANLNGIVIYN